MDDTNDTDILLLTFTTDRIHESSKGIIIRGNWEHIAIPAEAREYMIEAVNNALASITNSEGKIDLNKPGPKTWIERPRHGHWRLDAGEGIRLEIIYAEIRYYWDVIYKGECVGYGSSGKLDDAKATAIFAASVFAEKISNEFAAVVKGLKKVGK